MEKLPVPENITLRWEMWQGVGKKELTAILAVSFFALIVAVAFCIVSSAESDTLVATFLVVMIVALACGVFTKMDNNQSIYDYFRRQARFRREQQVFQWQQRKVKEGVYVVEEKEE